MPVVAQKTAANWGLAGGWACGAFAGVSGRAGDAGPSGGADGLVAVDAAGVAAGVAAGALGRDGTKRIMLYEGTDRMRTKNIFGI